MRFDDALLQAQSARRRQPWRKREANYQLVARSAGEQQELAIAAAELELTSASTGATRPCTTQLTLPAPG